jgi:hypothetical protein
LRDSLHCQGGFVSSIDGHDLTKDRVGIRVADRLTVTVRPVRDTTPASSAPARGQGPDGDRPRKLMRIHAHGPPHRPRNHADATAGYQHL